MMPNKKSPILTESKIVDVQFGAGVRIVEPSNLYGCQIDDGSFIGPFVEIQSKTTIGKNSRIESHTFICSLVEIGNDCFIGHGVTFTNDLFKNGHPSPNVHDWLPTIIGDHVAIGSGSSFV